MVELLTSLTLSRSIPSELFLTVGIKPATRHPAALKRKDMEHVVKPPNGTHLETHPEKDEDMNLFLCLHRSEKKIVVSFALLHTGPFGYPLATPEMPTAR